MEEKFETWPPLKSRFFKVVLFFTFYMELMSLYLANQGLICFDAFWTSSMVVVAIPTTNNGGKKSTPLAKVLSSSMVSSSLPFSHPYPHNSHTPSQPPSLLSLKFNFTSSRLSLKPLFLGFVGPQKWGPRDRCNTLNLLTYIQQT